MITHAKPVSGGRTHIGRLAWITWRQHRTTVLATIAVLAALGLWMTLLRSDLNTVAEADPGAIQTLTGTANMLLIAQMLCPLLIAAFWGAPLVAREYEQRTSVLIWTQSVRPIEWLLVKVVLLVSFAIAVSAVLGTLSARLAASIKAASPSTSLFASNYFEATPLLQGAYFAFAFALGIAAGALLRRSVPAIALSLLGFLVVRVLVAMVRPRFFPPERSVKPFTGDTGFTQSDLPGDNPLRLDVGYADSSGNPVSFPWMTCQQAGSQDAWLTCVRDNGVSDVVTVYQPGDRLALFQAVEAGLFTLATALLITFVIRRFRSRASLIG